MSWTIRTLKTLEEKQESRKLYDAAFGDPKIFTDYYYRDKCLDNQIIVKEKDGHIISMVHLNPYRLNVCGKEINAYYLVAVATDERYRHQGHMRDVLQTAFEQMKKEKIPFCYLMPVDQRIYQPFGFQMICDFCREKVDVEAAKKYEIYCIQDEPYLRRREKEEALASQLNGEGVLPEHPIIMAKVLDQDAFCKMSGLAEDSSESEKLDWLRTKRICICEEI